MADGKFAALNALYLINPKLGAKYQKKQFNPFEENFALSKEIALKLLGLQQEKKKVAEPNFLQNDIKSIVFAIKNAKKLMTELGQNIKEFPNRSVAQQKVAEGLLCLKICRELLSTISLSKVNYEEILDVYKTIISLSNNFGAMYDKFFSKDYVLEIAISDFYKLCTQPKKEVAKRIEKDVEISQNFQKSAAQAPVKRPPAKPKTVKFVEENLEK